MTILPQKNVLSVFTQQGVFKWYTFVVRKGNLGKTTCWGVLINEHEKIKCILEHLQ